MARNYILYESVVLALEKLSRAARYGTVLQTLSQSAEFLDMRFQQGEKATFHRINKLPCIRYPAKGGRAAMKEQWVRISLLLQASFSGINLIEMGLSPTINSELQKIYIQAQRLLRCAPLLFHLLMTTSHSRCRTK